MMAVRRLSEAEARRILSWAHSQCAGPAFAARRVRGGWAFAWASKDSPPPMGVRTVIVTDTGRAGTLKIGETADQGLAQLSEPNRKQGDRR